MKKRIWAYLLTVVMVVGLLPSIALAEDSETSGFCGATGNEQNVTWDFDSNTGVLTISGNGAMANYSASANTPWYRYFNNISKVIISSNVTTVGINAFKGCSNMTELELDDGVEVIMGSAFENCTGLTAITFPNSLKSFRGNAFKGCSGLTGTITIPDNVEDIRNWAFQNCTGITGVHIGNGVTEVNERAFSGCSSLESVTFGDKVKSIGLHAFSGTQLKSLTLPDGLETIGNDAFYNISQLTGNLFIPSNVKTIGERAFQSTSLSTIQVGKDSQLTSIGASAFRDCASMNTIDLSSITDSVSFKDYVFDHATGQSNLIILYVDSNATVTAITSTITSGRTIAYAVTDGGTFAENTEFEAGKLAEPSKDGFTFKGWYTDLDDENTKVTEPTAGETYYAKWEKKKDCTVTITPSVDSMRGKGTVTLTVTATPENILGDVKISYDGDIEVTKNTEGTYSASLPNKTQTYTFTAKYAGDDTYNASSATCTVSVTKKSSSPSNSSSASSTQTYTVSKADGMENGKVSVDLSKAEKGDKVTFTVTPDKGYEINKVTVKDANGNKIDLKEKGEGEYTFTMPDSKVEITATFSKAEETPVVEEVKPILLTIDQRVASVFGEPIINDVPPIIRNERTMLPIRFIAEALGGAVAWDGVQNKVTITKDDTTIEIYIGQPFALVNGAPIALDAPAFIENDRTYLPLRFVAEHLGATVTWNAETQEVTILPQK